MTSDNLKIETYKQDSNKIFITLLEFSSSELTENIYICDDPYELLPTAQVDGVVSNGQEYLYAPFSARMPKDDKTGTITAKLTIGNLDRRIVGKLRTVQSAVNMDVKIILSRDVDYVERHYQGLQLDNIQYDTMVIEGDLSMDYWQSEPFPSARFVPSLWPGLHP